VIDYSKLQQWALKKAGGDRAAAVEIILDEIESAAVNGDSVAFHARLQAMRRGLRDDLNEYCRTHHGRLTLTVVNATIPAGKAVHRRGRGGKVKQLHLPFIDMVFAELRDKIVELVGQQDRLYHNVLAAVRFLELETVCRGARTPREALDRLGVTAQEWLNGTQIIPSSAQGGSR
jgi:hypothetical protein